jgi:hypothetical protein
MESKMNLEEAKRIVAAAEQEATIVPDPSKTPAVADPAAKPKDNSTRTIFSIGYQGNSFDYFVKKLLKFKIGTVVDVRKVNLSKNQAYSGNTLREGLKKAGINYYNYRKLGVPGELFAVADGSPKYFGAVKEVLSKEIPSIVAVSRITGRVALLGFHADHDKCHRSIVAELMGARVVPLSSSTPKPQATATPAA